MVDWRLACDRLVSWLVGIGFLRRTYTAPSVALTDQLLSCAYRQRMSPTTDQETRAAANRAREPSDQRILRMTPGGYPGDSTKSILRRRLEAMGQAIRDQHLGQLLTV